VIFEKYGFFWPTPYSWLTSLSLHDFTDVNWVGSIDDYMSTRAYIVFF
jgi:hypothetical protein